MDFGIQVRTWLIELLCSFWGTEGSIACAFEPKRWIVGFNIFAYFRHLRSVLSWLREFAMRDWDPLWFGADITQFLMAIFPATPATIVALLTNVQVPERDHLGCTCLVIFHPLSKLQASIGGGQLFVAAVIAFGGKP